MDKGKLATRGRELLPAIKNVVKVGGSLFTWPELGHALRTWLATLPGSILLVPGGGPLADVIRDLDHRYKLGEESSHWLALRTLTINAHFLAHLVGGRVIAMPQELGAGRAVLDPHAFALEDDGRPGCLPHHWDVTSDSLAARAAVVAQANCLILLKSVAIPAGLSWDEAGKQKYVDPYFASVAAQHPGLEVIALNFRDRHIRTNARQQLG